MPTKKEKEVKERAERDRREGMSPSSQAGEFVREEIHHVREGKHGARSTKQAIAIGLSKARRAGVKLPASESASDETREQAARDRAAGRKKARGGRPSRASKKRSRAASRALKGEGRSAASKKALSRQAKSAAARRSKADRSRAAKKAAATRKKK